MPRIGPRIGCSSTWLDMLPPCQLRLYSIASLWHRSLREKIWDQCLPSCWLLHKRTFRRFLQSCVSCLPRPELVPFDFRLLCLNPLNGGDAATKELQMDRGLSFDKLYDGKCSKAWSIRVRQCRKSGTTDAGVWCPYSRYPMSWFDCERLSWPLI